MKDQEKWQSTVCLLHVGVGSNVYGEHQANAYLLYQNWFRCFLPFISLSQNHASVLTWNPSLYAHFGNLKETDGEIIINDSKINK